MHSKFKRQLIFAIIACSVMLFTAGAAASAAGAGIKRDEIREEIKKLLKEEPDLILDVLRDNSEVVLDVAQQGSSIRQLKILRLQWENDLTVPKSARLDGRPTIGNDNAPVTIVAFTDFTCAYCGRGQEVLKNIYDSYNGKVRLVYKNLPIATHPGSVEAAQFMLAAYAQDKSKGWALFNTFFANRTRILANDGHAFLRSSAIEAGLNITKLLEGARAQAVQKILDEDEQDADSLGFSGTPSFLVNNIMIRGMLDEDFFRIAVDMALAEAEKKK